MDYHEFTTKIRENLALSFLPGTTSDDRINASYWRDIQSIASLIHTEKLDGENNCLNRYGVFARSHAAPTQSAWTHKIRQRWQLLKNDLGDLELFGENLYAVHSIEYHALEQDFFCSPSAVRTCGSVGKRSNFMPHSLIFPAYPR